MSMLNLFSPINDPGLLSVMCKLPSINRKDVMSESNNVEGFKIIISRKELKLHCEERSKYHSKREKEKKKSLPELKDAMKKVTLGQTTSSNKLSGKSSNYNFNSDDPIADLERDILSHHNRVLLFQFYASHLIDSNYILKKEDLIELEMFPR